MQIKTTEGIAFTGNTKSTMLDSALAQGHVFEYSCKNGQCGVCTTTLLKGEVVELKTQQGLTTKEKNHQKILMCCCAPINDILIDAEELGALKDIEVKTLPARIHRIHRYTNNIMHVELRLPPSTDFQFLEGQYVDVIRSHSVRRSYSIANTAIQKTITLFIKRVDEGILSEYWFEHAKEKDLLRIEGPKGSFFFRKPAKHIIFIATGTGIAPIKAILDSILLSAKQYTDIKFTLYWGNRVEEDFFWKPEYELLNLKYIPVFSRESKQGYKTGYIQDFIFNDITDFSNTQVYACGLLSMIQSIHKQCVMLGLDEKSFHSDAFVSS